MKAYWSGPCQSLALGTFKLENQTGSERDKGLKKRWIGGYLLLEEQLIFSLAWWQG